MRLQKEKPLPLGATIRPAHKLDSSIPHLAIIPEILIQPAKESICVLANDEDELMLGAMAIVHKY